MACSATKGPPMQARASGPTVIRLLHIGGNPLYVCGRGGDANKGFPTRSCILPRFKVWHRCMRGPVRTGVGCCAGTPPGPPAALLASCPGRGVRAKASTPACLDARDRVRALWHLHRSATNQTARMAKTWPRTQMHDSCNCNTTPPGAHQALHSSSLWLVQPCCAAHLSAFARDLLVQHHQMQLCSPLHPWLTPLLLRRCRLAASAAHKLHTAEALHMKAWSSKSATRLR